MIQPLEKEQDRCNQSCDELVRILVPISGQMFEKHSEDTLFLNLMTKCFEINLLSASGFFSMATVV